MRHTLAIEYHSAVRKEWGPTAVTTWADLEGVELGEAGGTEKDKCPVISLIGGVQNSE